MTPTPPTDTDPDEPSPDDVDQRPVEGHHDFTIDEMDPELLRLIVGTTHG